MGQGGRGGYNGYSERAKRASNVVSIHNELRKVVLANGALLMGMAVRLG